ncbi:MAG: hypothetical protein AAGE94_16170 [Acidobacteriota bacterium]
MPLDRPHRLREVRLIVVAAAFLGALSSLGDWIWFRFLTDGDPVAGIAHGAIFFVALAAVLGWSAGTWAATRRLLLALPIAGVLLAAAFYPLYFVVGYLGSLLVTWVGMWITLAFAQRWARAEGESARRAVLRGVAAAIGSGLAFYLVKDMWTAPSPDGPDLVGHAWRWAFAFFPGLLALGIAHPPAGASAPTEG